MIRIQKTDFPLTPLNKHFCLKLGNTNGGSNIQPSNGYFDGSMCNHVSTIIESVETTINVSESEQSHTGADSEHSEWDEVSDSSSDDFNFQGEYKAFQIRAELEDDSAWEINEVRRTKESNKHCFEESSDSFINDMDTPENPKELCAKRPEELIRLKSEVSKLPS